MDYNPSDEVGMTPEDTRVFEALLLPAERTEFLHQKFAAISARLAREAIIGQKQFKDGFAPPVVTRIGRKFRKR